MCMENGLNVWDFLLSARLLTRRTIAERSSSGGDVNLENFQDVPAPSYIDLPLASTSIGFAVAAHGGRGKVIVLEDGRSSLSRSADLTWAAKPIGPWWLNKATAADM